MEGLTGAIYSEGFKKKIQRKSVREHQNLQKLENIKNIATLNLNKSNTKALYSGIIEEKYIEIGEFVSTGNKMIQLISKEQLEVIAEVPSFRTFYLSVSFFFYLVYKGTNCREVFNFIFFSRY